MGRCGNIFSSFILVTLGFFFVLDFLPYSLEEVWPVRILKCSRCFGVCFCSWLISNSMPLSSIAGLSGLAAFAVINIKRKFFNTVKEEAKRNQEYRQNILNHYNEIDHVAIELSRDNTSRDAKSIMVILSKSEMRFDEIVGILGPDNMKEDGQGELRRKAPTRSRI